MTTTIISSEWTVSEKILLAADALDKLGQTSFTAEALIVASWRHFPQTFGLKGYVDLYPDSNKVLTSIMGEKGLPRRGWLIKVGSKEYALTREGRKVLAHLLKQEEELPSQTLRLTRDKEKALIALFDSTAMRKFEEGRKQELTSADAWRLWNITQNLKGDAVDERLDQVSALLIEVERDLAHADVELAGGRVINAGDLRVLANLHRYMLDRFAQHLNLLRSRPERR